MGLLRAMPSNVSTSNADTMQIPCNLWLSSLRWCRKLTGYRLPRLVCAPIAQSLITAHQPTGSRTVWLTSASTVQYGSPALQLTISLALPSPTSSLTPPWLQWHTGSPTPTWCMLLQVARTTRRMMTGLTMVAREMISGLMTATRRTTDHWANNSDKRDYK